MMLKTMRKAQSFIEYALLISVILAALAAMSAYMRYAINYRLKATQQELDETKR